MTSSCKKNGSSCDTGASAPRLQNRVYLDKIFFDQQELSCPLITPLTANIGNFTQELQIGGTSYGGGCGNCSGGCGGCGCGCGNCGGGCSGCSCCNFDLNCNTKFTVTNSCVVINDITLSDSAVFPSNAVTVDGFPVSALMPRNGRYVADLSGIMPDITKCPCAPIDRHLCETCGSCSSCPPACNENGHFFLAETPGPWNVSLSIVLEGTVSNGKQTCEFKLTCKTRNDSSGFFPISAAGSSNFAIRCAEIPCQVNGIAPSLIFDFYGCGVLLNPTLQLAAETPSTCPEAVSLVLTSNLVLTPGMHLQIIRPTLFALQGNEIGTCCDDLGQCTGVESLNAAPQPCSCRQNTAVVRTRPQTACQCCDTNGYLF